MPPALVLAAGLATRLRPLSWMIAKAALPVAGEPLIVRVLRWLASHGISEAVVNLHHRPETITAVTGDGSRFGVRVRYSWEQPLLGSGGGPARAFSLVDDDELLVVNGDTLTDLDVGAVYAAHRASGALVTLGLIENPRPEKYGGVQLYPHGAVARFTPRGHRPTGWHFVGVQIVRRAVFDEVPSDAPSESVGQIYPRLMADRPGSVRGWIGRGTFEDIGTPSGYLETCLRLSAGDSKLLIATGARVAAGARLKDTVCWDGAEIAEDTELIQCIVCNGTSVPRGSLYHRSVLMPADLMPLAPGDFRDGSLAVSPIDR
jgi:NDP-sugar pyrophosphorylase family protein